MAKSSVGEAPQNLRPYLFHRVELEWIGDADAKGTCPFCAKEGHFYVSQKTGQYHCKVCPDGGKGGNVYTFLRKLVELSSVAEAELEMVAEERKVSAATLARWGLSRSPIDGEWILASYDPAEADKPAKVNNVYRWSKIGGKRRLLATPTLSHGMFGLQFWDPKKPDAYLTEGPWDGMALEEAFKRYRKNGERVQRVADEGVSIYASANIVPVPGAEVFKDNWTKHFLGKHVKLLYDNDHPRENPKAGKVSPPVGHAGMVAAAKKLKGIAASIQVIDWARDGGKEGYDPTLPDGFDVRDFLNQE